MPGAACASAEVVLELAGGEEAAAGDVFRFDPHDVRLRAAVPREQRELLGVDLSQPLDPQMLPRSARRFFQVGEFVGWIIAAPEREV